MSRRSQDKHPRGSSRVRMPPYRNRTNKPSDDPYCWPRSQREQMSTWRWHRAQKQSGIVHRSPRRGGLDDPTSPGNTAYGAVRKCGSGRSLGRDRQVNSVRGCVGLFADSDLTPTLPRRHRGYPRRRRPAIGNIRSGGKQQQDSGGVAGTTQSMFALFRHIQLMRAVRRISALLRSHQQGHDTPAARGRG